MRLMRLKHAALVALFVCLLTSAAPAYPEWQTQDSFGFGGQQLAFDAVLLTKDSFTYLGAFRLPRTVSNGDDLSFGGPPMAVNSVTNTMYVASRKSWVAEVSIPPLVNTADFTAMNFAIYVQALADPTEGRMVDIATLNLVALRGLAVLGNRLCGTAMIYYDATNSQRVSHFCRTLSLSTPSFSGWSAVGTPEKTGHVAGWLAPVPPEWQAALGGTALTGNCCVPIVTRTSFGPAAFAIDAAAIGQPAVNAVRLLDYPAEHPTLGRWEDQNSTYGMTTTINGMAVIGSTVLYVGRNGLGPVCYGKGTTDKSLLGTIDPLDGGSWCYDPTSPYKGPHAYPYVNQVLLYALSEFAAVKAGSKQPWEVTPYAVFPLNLPTPDRGDMGGASYDAQRQILYVSQLGADQDGYAGRALIHAFQIHAPTPPPVPVPTPGRTTYAVLTVGATPVPISPVVLVDMRSCTVTAETARVRWRQDGIAPTTTIGYPLVTGQERTVDIEDARRLQFVRATASTAKVHVFCRQ